jgi:hypothetical protein
MHIYQQQRCDRTMKLTVSFLTGLFLACALLGSGAVVPAAAESRQQLTSHNLHQPIGSWLVTYDVPAFFVPIPILLSFGRDGVMIETDSPAPTPVGNLGTLILSNGHGAWEPKKGGEFAYLYRKLIYKEDGFTPFGTTRTTATGTVSAHGTQFQAEILIEFLDVEGKVVLRAPGTATGTRIQVDEE